MNNKKIIAVLGAGSFGTAIANLAALNGHEVRLWMRSERQANEIKNTHINSRYLPKSKLSENIQAHLDLETAVLDCDHLFVAVPSKSVRQVVEVVAPFLSGKTKLLSLTKGIEPSSFLLMSQVLQQLVPNHSVAVISGPNLAKEIASGTISASVVAGSDLTQLEEIKHIISSDILGVEFGGALKNIYAIISGMIAALGFGENSRAMVVTRALAEMTRFAVKHGANPMTLMGLAGIGDLVVTCGSSQSRNYQVGFAIGQGHSVAQAVSLTGETAEGINTLKVIQAQALELKIAMPLVQGLFDVIFEGCDAEDVMSNLMATDRVEDVEFMVN
ncbi:MAG: NAD(P)-dependent glycerol-3-phosphate dehydrogenase [Saccharospirillaceae bacterium]|nr:NAD(P)-dependent glycerol-3-phosphate dehydrogenase [Pseudomonadales bacterium]NRB80225.1 NAD(P)-dependent glycerol-3-phosphate dehydrogenase [Saccharospirillaceae bacterium]